MRWCRRSAATLPAGIAGLVSHATSSPLLAATPAPTAGIGDPRSSGQGAGLVGDPLLAVAVVAGIALLSLFATLAYVRATERSAPSDRRSR